MRLALAIVLVFGACDRVLGLKTSQLADGPSPDAPPSCPAPASGLPPRFSPVFHQFGDLDCSYTTSDVRDLGVAFCESGSPPLLVGTTAAPPSSTLVIHPNIANPFYA